MSILRSCLAPLLLAFAALAASGCATAERAPEAPRSGFVTDVASFDAFIETRPTPERFRAIYPDVTLVLPGQPATKELRMNNSRYFADVDGDGRITGGRFQ